MKGTIFQSESSRSLSPRMRGTHDHQPEALWRHRFILAHAGNTEASPGCAGDRPVHPRACGEHRIAGLARRHGLGSSPRMRGTRWSIGEVLTAIRFIPAHAGNTNLYSRFRIIREVHPRACGEHIALDRMHWRSAGSSPRMRGTRVAVERIRQPARFIPAHAGNTRPSGRQKAGRTVHPRACGEHSTA